jgi:putative endonuclease
MKCVYILRSICSSAQRYVGVTADLVTRLDYHNSGRCPHTSKFMPWEVVYTERFERDADALKRERQIKGWTRAKKEALIAGDKLTLKKFSRRRGF